MTSIKDDILKPQISFAKSRNQEQRKMPFVRKSKHVGIMCKSKFLLQERPMAIMDMKAFLKAQPTMNIKNVQICYQPVPDS